MNVKSRIGTTVLRGGLFLILMAMMTGCFASGSHIGARDEESPIDPNPITVSPVLGIDHSTATFTRSESSRYVSVVVIKPYAAQGFHLSDTLELLDPTLNLFANVIEAELSLSLEDR